MNENWIEQQNWRASRAELKAAAAERSAVREKIGELVNKMVFTYAVYAPLEALLSWLEDRDAQDHQKPWGERVARKITAGIPRTYGENARQAGAAYSREELDRAVAAAEKDMLAPLRGNLVAFFPTGEAKVLASLDSRAVGGGVLSRRERMISLPTKAGAEEVITVAIDLAPRETPEERARREGKEEGLELARRAVVEHFNRKQSPYVGETVLHAIDKAAGTET